jgi:membrane protease YdiL (CAAX protease family)
MEKLMIWVFALFVLLNEIILGYYDNSYLGFLLYSFLLTCVLFVLAKEGISKDFKILNLGLAVIPLIRIAELFLDVGFEWKVLILHGSLLGVATYYLLRYDVDFVGDLRRAWILPFAVVVGSIFGILGSVFFEGEGLFLFAILPLICISNEVFFRGLLQGSISKIAGSVYGIFFPALICAILSGHFGVYFAFLIFMAGITSGVAYAYSRNIFFSIIVNFVFFFLALIL